MNGIGQTEVKSGEVFSALANLRNRQEVLSKSLTILNDRLTPICGQPKSENPDKACPKQEIVCQIAQEIHALNDNCARHIDSVDSLLSRLEI
jgi:hypothetical protein